MKEGKSAMIGRKHILLRCGIPILPILLLLLAITSGCAGGGMKGMKAPEYEPLLDWDYAMENFGFEALIEGMDYDDNIRNIEALMQALGIDRIRQDDLDARKTEDTVSVRSFWEHRRRLRDKSLARAILKWEPVKPGLVKGFQEDDLVGMFALGNPTDLVDISLDWFINSGAFDDLIEDIHKDQQRDAKAGYAMARMTAKGYWVEAQEELFPYIGDEIALAVYVNRDFADWDYYGDEDTFDKVSPVHIIIAVELEQPGLADVLKEVYENNEGLLKDLLLAPSYEYDEHYGLPEPEEDYMVLRTKKIGGERICYIDIDGFVQVAWYETDNTLFIGDLAAIENIDDYFDAFNPTSGAPDEYCKFTYLDGDMLVENVVPDEEFERWEDDLDDLRSYYSKAEAEIIGEFYKCLRAEGEYGLYQKVFVTKGEGFETTLQCSKRIADIYLLYLNIAEASGKESGFNTSTFETVLPLYLLF